MTARADATPAPGTLLVDARAIAASGIGRYLRELLARWLAAPPFERTLLLGDPATLDGFLDTAGARDASVGVARHVGGFYSAAAQRSWAGLRASGALRCSAAFFPHWDAPLLAMPRASVVTVHDLIHFKVPDAFPAMRRLVAAGVLARVTASAARVVTVSAATAHDLTARHPGVAPKVRVIPNGVSRLAGDAGAAPDRLPGGAFLLCVGNQKPHKNLAAAVEVLARLRPRHGALRLVLAGARFPGADSLLRRAASLGVADAVDDLGPVDDATLRALYERAAVVLFPSRYEGFGLPVLEAMLAGTPVVAAHTPAVVEVAGDAALLRAPDDVAGMADAVEALLARAELRDDLVRRGRERAACFSWDAAAAGTAAVLREAAGSSAAGRID